MSTTVHVKNISPETSDKEVRDFFSFCGKITDIQVSTEGETKTATITFEKETACKTAVLLNNTQLGPNNIQVTGPSTSEGEGSPGHAHGERDTDEIKQEDKPRSRIFAEYLAHGYIIGDNVLQQAIELDHKHNVSARFLSTLQNLDQKYHAVDRAKAADQSYNITNRASALLSGINSYFEKATNTPTGRQIVKFYTERQHQLQDIHNEARRLAELKKQEKGQQGQQQPPAAETQAAQAAPEAPKA